MAGANPLDLLNELERILDSDPLIDEVGFIHPSQFAALREEAGTPPADEILGSRDKALSDSVFWSRDHKLGISTCVILPLYGAAKHAFMSALEKYKMHKDSCRESNYMQDGNASVSPSLLQSIFETEVMKHSRALLLLSCDFGTAWNSRKLLVSKKQQFQLFMDELCLSTLILSYSPKSERAWGHRKWAIKMIAGMHSNLEEIVDRESELVEKMAEKSKMNYRVWNHRSWLVSYMSGQQVIQELNKSRDWAGLHVADNSCFHYRARVLHCIFLPSSMISAALILRILIKMLDCASHKQHSDVCVGASLHELWKEELDWVEMLIKLYVGREALWLHRRFLSLCWIKHFYNNSSSCPKNIMDIEIFMDKELHLCYSCFVIPDNDFEDYQAQAMFSATYIMWLVMQLASPLRIQYRKKLDASGLKGVLNNYCPEKIFLWDTLTANSLPSS